MAKKRNREQAYHCDGFYFSGICPFRGVGDPADIRYRDGWSVLPHSLCNNFGLDERDRLCRHCIENKEYFPPDLVKVRYSAPNGQVVSLTPYQAKNSETKTIRAFTALKQLSEYLKEHQELYGVDVRTGELIGVGLE